MASVGDAAVELAAQLVSVDSVNPGLVADAAGESQIVGLLAARLSHRGFAVEVVPALEDEGRPSLIATYRGTGGGRSLVLNGHLDTVGVEGMDDPFGARIEGDRETGRLYGRGACDMKAGIAAMVVAAEEVAAQGSAGDIILALVSDEENASVGTEAVLAHLAGGLPDACLIGEPTWLDFAATHRGYAVVEVGFEGRASHSAQPELGVNAVAHLGRFLVGVEEQGMALAAGQGHPVAGNGSLMATVASGGVSPFLIPATASAVVERRTVPGERAADCLDEVGSILGEMRRSDPSVQTSVSVSLSREAWEFDPKQTAGAALSEVLGGALVANGRPEPRHVAFPYWMESALWEEAGVPTVVCGPAGDGLHAAEEWVDLAQVRAFADGLVSAIRSFCGSK